MQRKNLHTLPGNAPDKSLYRERVNAMKMSDVPSDLVSLVEELCSIYYCNPAEFQVTAFHARVTNLLLARCRKPSRYQVIWQCLLGFCGTTLFHRIVYFLTVPYFSLRCWWLDSFGPRLSKVDPDWLLGHIPMLKSFQVSVVILLGASVYVFALAPLFRLGLAVGLTAHQTAAMLANGMRAIAALSWVCGIWTTFCSILVLLCSVLRVIGSACARLLNWV